MIIFNTKRNGNVGIQPGKSKVDGSVIHELYHDPNNEFIFVPIQETMNFKDLKEMKSEKHATKYLKYKFGVLEKINVPVKR